MHAGSGVGSLCRYFGGGRRGEIALVLNHLIHRGCTERQLFLVGVEGLLLQDSSFDGRLVLGARLAQGDRRVDPASTRIWLVWRCTNN